MGVAEERDALTVLGEAARLFGGHEGLAAARSPADLDAVEEFGGVEDDGLVFGEDVGGGLVLQGSGDDVALRQAAAVEGGLELVDALARQ